MIAVAIVGRMLLLPMPASEDLSRRLWEGDVLDTNMNPYELSPSSEELRLLRDRRWEPLKTRIRYLDSAIGDGRFPDFQFYRIQ